MQKLDLVLQGGDEVLEVLLEPFVLDGSVGLNSLDEQLESLGLVVSGFEVLLVNLVHT